MSRRVAAVIALLSLAVGVIVFVYSIIVEFPRGFVSVALLVAVGFIAWQGLIRGGRVRTMTWVLAAVVAIAAVLVLASDGIQYSGLAVVVLLGIFITAGKRAFSVHVRMPAAPPPQRAVVVWNPKSGGGKAVTNNLAEEARKRGIEPIELKPGVDLVALVQDAVARGADGLMAAGGDGTQALVATIAAEHDLPFACIPAGTRNHFALDLGVDRNDVVGALDAFVNGWEKRVDLGEVGGRVFVNNVSLGLYAEAVQNASYRNAKIRTLIYTVPTMLSPTGTAPDRDLRWTGPDGTAQHSAAVILVSNDVYRLGRAIGSGTRPRLDDGQLGIAVIGAPTPGGHRRPLVQWAATEFMVESDGDVPIGVDGEALQMPTPLVFRIRPGALRVRIAPQHPGASPSAAQPTGMGDGLSKLLSIATGKA
jgi:diacylglycerol kinase family enzyme